MQETSQNQTKIEPFFCQTPIVPINQISQITPQDLIKNLTDPAKFFLQHSLGIKIEQSAPILLENEPFALEYQNKFNLRDLLFKAANLNWNKAEQAAIVKACNYLPLAQIGQVWWRKEFAPIAKFWTQIGSKISEKPSNISIDLTLNNLQIKGDLNVTPFLASRDNNLQVMEYRLYEIGGYDFTAFWLKHLLLNSAFPTVSYLATPQIIWRADTLPDYAEYLIDWLDIFTKAQTTPSLLIPKISYALVRDLHNPKVKKEFENAQKKWQEIQFKKQWYKIAYQGFNPIETAEFVTVAENLYHLPLQLINQQAEL